MRDNYNELSGCNTDKNNLEKDRVDYDSHLNSLVQKVSNTILYSPLTKNLYSSLYNVVAPPILQPIGNAIRALNVVLGCDDSVNINNIEQWEESHDNDNKELRNTLDAMKSNRLTTPFAVAYEKFMDKKELREAAFPFKSLKHTIAATDIFPGIKYKNYKISYPVFLDVEYSGGRADGIDRNTRTQVIKAFCETIKNSGYTPGVYANKTWLNSYMNAGELNSYKIWLAQYNTAPTYSGKFDMWQYSSKGQVGGISGNTDMNLSYMGY